MILIYTGEETYIRLNADAAKEILIKVYGEQLGLQAYEATKRNIIGTVFRCDGGPYVKVISNEEVVSIVEKERKIGRLVE